MKRLAVAAALVFLSRAPRVFAEVGSTGAELLKLGTGARSLAMGEAVSAGSPGVEGLYANPAELARLSRPSVMLSYHPIVETLQYNQAAFAFRLRSFSFGVGYGGLSQSPLPAYDAVGNRIGEFSASDQLGLVGAAVGDERFGAGVTGKILSSTIDGVSARATAVDAGVSFENPFLRRLRHALALHNAGGSQKFLTEKEAFPASATFGNALALGSRVLLTADLARERGAQTVCGSGLEWVVGRSAKTSLAFRAGYSSRRASVGSLGGLTAGAGFGFSSLSFDYAWVPFGDLGTSQAVTLIWRIPPPKPSPPSTSGRRKLRTLRATDKNNADDAPSAKKRRLRLDDMNK